MLKQTDLFFDEIFSEVYEKSRLSQEHDYIQHGDTTTLLHSIAVAYYSYLAAKKLSFFKFRARDVIRGGLLHDYYLYDWHIAEPGRKLHGFYHPSYALENADKDFSLSPVEKDIIKKHMFPMTPAFPRYKETLLICIVDKICSTYEIFARSAYTKKTFRALATV